MLGRNKDKIRLGIAQKCPFEDALHYNFFQVWKDWSKGRYLKVEGHSIYIFFKPRYELLQWPTGGTNLHMVKCHENAYSPKNLSLFAFNIEGY